MSGIAGIQAAADAPAPEAATLGALARALAHRGPDGAGHTAVGRTALVHTRLAVSDPEGGDQPLFAGPAALVGDGAITNAADLRRTLEHERWATGADKEAALHLFVRDAAGFAAGLRGMYAIAVHDRAARTVTLARDPFGIKPLYLAQTDHCLAFASEPQALLAAGLVKRALRPAGRDELLQMQFTTGAETIFEGIRRVLPGETLVCAEGRVLERRHIQGLPDGPPEEIGEDAALERLDLALAESLGRHRSSDVPYGVFLSGGADSAAVLTALARLDGNRVPAYTPGFDAPGAAAAAAQAADVARAMGARHERVDITEAMVWQELPRIVAAMDDPAADYAIIPAWFLARRAGAEVKVVLTGEGGDEIFAGYGRYRSAMRPWFLGGRVMRARGTFDRVDVLRARPAAWRDGIAAAEAQGALGGRSRLATAQATDIADWLPHDVLLKLDRCLMAHGVEGRAPLLDPEVAAAAFRLPDGLKVRGERGKWLLRLWLDRHCPAAHAFARRQGVALPIGRWIAAQGARLGPLVAAQPGVAEIADPARVTALFRSAAGHHQDAAAWHLLFYALWHRTHIQGLAPAGDVFDSLATT